MTENLEQQLLYAAPLFFGDGKFACGSGFCCGDGWYEPLYQFACKAENIVRGLTPDENSDPPLPLCVQIKEKFGGLRVYYAGPLTDALDRAITEAEEACWKTCCVCGGPGALDSVGGWMTTVCEGCKRTAS